MQSSVLPRAHISCAHTFPQAEALSEPGAGSRGLTWDGLEGKGVRVDKRSVEGWIWDERKEVGRKTERS